MRVLTFYMNGSVVGNGEVVVAEKENLLLPKNLEDACSDALNYDDLVVAVDFVSPTLEIKFDFLLIFFYCTLEIRFICF